MKRIFLLTVVLLLATATWRVGAREATGVLRFEPGGAGWTTTAEGILLETDLPEGNYRVTVTLGGEQASRTTIASENRRLMAENIATEAGQTAVCEFLVDVRTPRLSPGNTIKLNSREWDSALDVARTPTWDERLTLRFTGEPAVRAVEIAPADDEATRVFLIGDSTVTDGGGSWGSALPRWFDASVVVANHAESGQTMKMFRFSRRWDKMIAGVRPGDYVFMQFGHNDSKATGHDAMWPEGDEAGDWAAIHSEAATDYVWMLATNAVEIRRRGGIPVIVSPMTRIDRATGRANPRSHGDYPAAARRAAELVGCAFIDLHAMSLELLAALTPDEVRACYTDATHSTPRGGYLFSQCVVRGIRSAGLDLAGRLSADAPALDPARPDGRTPLRFDFGTDRPAEGYTAVTPDTRYSAGRGYGFEPRAEGSPLFQFSVAAAEGNYRVTVTLGGEQASTTTVKAETGRLVLEQIATAPGEQVRHTFTVNVRNRSLSAGNTIKLDVREWDPATDRPVTFTWDDKLTLQFSGENPAVATVEIVPASDAVTVFLTGDSTVTDQASEPYGTWGQQLGRWFDDSVAVANHAESGQTLKAFRFQRRWDKVMQQMRPGDYVFLQFGHNDLNQRGHDAMWPAGDAAGDWVNTHSDALTDYCWTLAAYAAEVARRGGIPVIVSPMTKMSRQTGLVNATGLGDYPEGARRAAGLAGCAFIDLHAMSVAVVEALGPEGAPAAYVDGLHTNTYGGYLLARCVVEGIRAAGLPLAAHIRADAGTFDPKYPRPLPADFTLPLDPRVPVPAPPGFPPRNRN